MPNQTIAPLIASLAMRMMALQNQPFTGPMQEPPGKGMDVRTIYPEAFPEELGRVYSDWQGDPSEKMVFLDKRDRLGVLRGQKGRVGTTLKELVSILARNNMSMDKLQEIVHNHNKGEKTSPADLEFLDAVKKLGFKGSYKVYYPKERRLREEK